MSEIDYNQLFLLDEQLHAIRHDLYHSKSPGFYIFRNYLPEAYSEHVATFWEYLDTEDWHKPFPGKNKIHLGCSNFYSIDKQLNRSFFNFLWNSPPDEFTHILAYQFQLLRNRIESREPYREIYPLTGRAISYRVSISKHGNNIVPEHSDWMGDEFDPRRTQITLFLSDFNKDYSGNGFYMETNQGKKVYFGKDLNVSKGDLVIWRYNNKHGVDTIRSTSSQRGFMRIILPPEEIHKKTIFKLINKSIMVNLIAKIPYSKKIYNTIFK